MYIRQEYNKKWKQENRERHNAHTQKWRDNNRTKLMFIGAKARAKKKGIPFDIELSDIVIPKKCPVLGIKLCAGNGRMHGHSPSLDRIDNTMGYIKGNILVVSQLANVVKSDMTLTRLREHAEELKMYAKNSMKVAKFYETLLSEGV